MASPFVIDVKSTPSRACECYQICEYGLIGRGHNRLQKCLLLYVTTFRKPYNLGFLGLTNSLHSLADIVSGFLNLPRPTHPSLKRAITEDLLVRDQYGGLASVSL